MNFSLQGLERPENETALNMVHAFEEEEKDEAEASIICNNHNDS